MMLVYLVETLLIRVNSYSAMGLVRIIPMIMLVSMFQSVFDLAQSLWHCFLFLRVVKLLNLFLDSLVLILLCFHYLPLGLVCRLRCFLLNVFDLLVSPLLVLLDLVVSFLSLVASLRLSFLNLLRCLFPAILHILSGKFFSVFNLCLSLLINVLYLLVSLVLLLHNLLLSLLLLLQDLLLGLFNLFVCFFL